MSDDDTRVIDDPDASAARLDLDDIERRAKQAVAIGTWHDDQGGPVTLALIARIRDHDARVAACEVEIARLLPLADAAVAFVDEQGKRVDIDRGYTIDPPEDFAASEFEALVRAVEGAGR